MEKRHLTLRKNTWFVRKRVPPSLRHVLGAELSRSTGTHNLAEARRRRYAILADLQQEIDHARERAGAKPGSSAWVRQEARAMIKGVREGTVSRETLDEVGLDYLLSELVRLKGYKLDEHGHPIITDRATTEAVDAAAELLQGGPDLARLSDAIDTYLNEKEGAIRQQTMNTKRRQLGAFAQWTGDRPVVSITRADAGRYVGEVLLKRREAPKTTQDTISNLSAFFKWARTRGLTEINPFEGQASTISKNTRGGGRFKRRPWKPEEIEKMLTGLNRSDPMQDRLWALLAIGAYSGMRLNEICETELKDVYDTHIHLPEGKTESSVRDVPIHPVLKPLIKKLTKDSTDGYLIDGLPRGGEDEKRSHYASKRFGAIKRRLGVVDMHVEPSGAERDRIPFHALRHTVVTAMQEAGVPLEVRRAIVGHSTGDVHQDIYTHYGIKGLANAISKLSYGKRVDDLVKNGSRY